MKILVLNSGSSSIKYQLFEMPGDAVIARGVVQRIGEPEGEIAQTIGSDEARYVEPIADHAAGLRRVMSLLPGTDQIGAVGHRVVHGGEHFTDTALIDDAVLEAIEAHIPLAPLHNPPNLLGIRVARELLPAAPQVAVFDTAFHQGMPEQAYLYGLPLELYREAGIRRYGFHGTSHRFVVAEAAALLGRPVAELDLITCHLGNGSSIAAVRGGRSVDTSMGLTPLEGLVMGTRSGDLDPAILFHLVRERGMTVDAIDTLLNKQSGLLGLSGASNDVRQLLELRAEGDARARLALEVFAYRIRKYIGAYLAVLGGIDALIFTAGIGENAAELRAMATTGLEPLGIAVDDAANRATVGRAGDIASASSKARVLVVPTNEELAIARDTHRLAVA